jgi:hypothetical protein
MPYANQLGILLSIYGIKWDILMLRGNNCVPMHICPGLFEEVFCATAFTTQQPWQLKC